MSKKLITACLALVALAAFVLPAVASASPVITHPTADRLDPTIGGCTSVAGTICLTGTGVSSTKILSDPAEGTTATTLFECSKSTVTGYLTKNNGTEIEATIHTATFEGTGNVITGGPMHECSGFGAFGNMTPTTNGGGVDGESITSGTPWCFKSGASDTFAIRG